MAATGLKPGTARRVVAYACLAMPFVAILWVPFYARTQPRLAGLPFFYWYQFAWIVLTVGLMLTSYRLLRRPAVGASTRAPVRASDEDPPELTPPSAAPEPGGLT